MLNVLIEQSVTLIRRPSSKRTFFPASAVTQKAAPAAEYFPSLQSEHRSFEIRLRQSTPQPVGCNSILNDTTVMDSLGLVTQTNPRGCWLGGQNGCVLKDVGIIMLFKTWRHIILSFSHHMVNLFLNFISKKSVRVLKSHVFNET